MSYCGMFLIRQIYVQQYLHVRCAIIVLCHHLTTKPLFVVVEFTYSFAYICTACFSILNSEQMKLFARKHGLGKWSVFPRWRCLEQARFLPYPKGEMFTAPEGAHQVLLAEVYFSSDPVDNLGVGGTHNRKEFRVSESVFPDPKLFI